MGTPIITWEGALRSFLLHKKANRAESTTRFYRVQLTQLVNWANEHQIKLDDFGKRSLDAYLSDRLDKGTSRTTLRHDSLCATVFTKWCSKNDYLKRDPLAEYEVRKAPAPPKFIPSAEDMACLVEAIPDFWDPHANPDIREISPAKRDFHRDRNFALILTLVDSACRIGEVLSLQVSDYRSVQVGPHETERQITVRESKGREPRVIPISEGTGEAIEDWLKVRRRILKDVPAEEDEGWLFLSETGTRILDRVFRRAFSKYVRYAKLPTQLTLHGLRRFSLNKLAKHNLLMAQAIAGHKNPQTTLIYTKIDPDFVRQEHQEVGVVRSIMRSKRAVKRPRLI